MKITTLVNPRFFLFAFAAFVFLVAPYKVSAQESVTAETVEAEVASPLITEIFPPRPLSPVEDLPPAEGMIKRVQQKVPEVSVDQLGSIFLTSQEESVIASARQGLVTRAPTDMEFDDEQNLEGDIVKPTGPREISLGGVLYVSPDEWTVWINSEKITPKNIPSSIIDIRVAKDTVKLKWFDVQTNQIFPIKLRPHQRFNLDTRIFLPGT